MKRSKSEPRVEEKLNTQTQFIAPLWGGQQTSMGFAFFCLIASFGGQKLEILDCYHTGQHFLFRGSLNFALFHFSCKAHKKIRLGSEKKLMYLFYRQVDGFAPTFSTKPTIRQDTDGSLVFHCSILADPRPVVSWFHNGDKIQDNKKFQVSVRNSPHYYCCCLYPGKHLTF